MQRARLALGGVNHDMTTLKMRKVDEALFAAVERGDLGKAVRCLESGAEANAVSPIGSPGAYTPLMLAVLLGHTRITEALLQRDADPSAETPGEPGVASRTLLSVAVANARVEIVRLLLQHGAAVNGRNDLGLTALSLARRWERRSSRPIEMQEVIELLLQAGASE